MIIPKDTGKINLFFFKRFLLDSAFTGNLPIRCENHDEILDRNGKYGLQSKIWARIIRKRGRAQ
jgi:hypothetical protein